MSKSKIWEDIPSYNPPQRVNQNNDPVIVNINSEQEQDQKQEVLKKEPNQQLSPEFEDAKFNDEISVRITFEYKMKSKTHNIPDSKTVLVKVFGVLRNEVQQLYNTQNQMSAVNDVMMPLVQNAILKKVHILGAEVVDVQH